MPMSNTTATPPAQQIATPVKVAAWPACPDWCVGEHETYKPDSSCMTHVLDFGNGIRIQAFDSAYIDTGTITRTVEILSERLNDDRFESLADFLDFADSVAAAKAKLLELSGTVTT